MADILANMAAPPLPKRPSAQEDVLGLGDLDNAQKEVSTWKLVFFALSGLFNVILGVYAFLLYYEEATTLMQACWITEAILMGICMLLLYLNVNRKVSILLFTLGAVYQGTWATLVSMEEDGTDTTGAIYGVFFGLWTLRLLGCLLIHVQKPVKLMHALPFSLYVAGLAMTPSYNDEPNLVVASISMVIYVGILVFGWRKKEFANSFDKEEVVHLSLGACFYTIWIYLMIYSTKPSQTTIAYVAYIFVSLFAKTLVRACEKHAREVRQREQHEREQREREQREEEAAAVHMVHVQPAPGDYPDDY